MNPLEFSGSKEKEDTNGFIDEVYKTLYIIRLTSREKAELASYKLNVVVQVLYE